MNKATLEGYINIGQFGGVKTTSTGKECTTFQLASGKGEKRMYFNCTCWHDEYGTERGVVDGKFAMIECYPRAWKKDGKSGVVLHSAGRERLRTALKLYEKLGGLSTCLGIRVFRIME